MSFLSPIWWWALAGLLVPLAIHLLSRGRRQRIAIGSIRHVAAAESRALRRLKLSGWPQLLIRMLLLAALTLALVGPRGPWPWRDHKPGTWVFIDPELAVQVGRLREADQDFWLRMEAARNKASSVRLLAVGLPELATGVPMDGEEDAWSLLREADGIAPAASNFEVFTLDRVDWVRGRRPHLARQVDWWVLPESQPNCWIQRAVVTEDDEWVVTVGESRPEGTRFVNHAWSASGTPPEDSVLEIEPESGTLELRFKDRRPEDNSVERPIPSGPIRVALQEAADRALDAWHLQRALAAVGTYLGRRVVWVDPGASSVDLEIRLGEVAGTGRMGTVVLGDREVPFESCDGRVFARSKPVDPWLRLERCSTTRLTRGGVPVWTDNWGRAFLIQQPAETGATYELAGRFDPRWSNLATSPALPHLLVELIVPGNASAGGAATTHSDRRATTGQERMPGFASSSQVKSKAPSRALESLAWLLVALLLVLERGYSARLG